MSTQRKSTFEDRLKKYPNLQKHYEEVLSFIESGEIEKAHEAEEFILDQIRALGKEAIYKWATHQADQKADDVRTNNKEARGHGKKNSTGTQRSGE